MIIFSKPNLPDECKVAVCDKNHHTEKIFEKIISTADINTLPLSMRKHADLQICHIGKGTVLCAPEVYDYYKNALSPFGVKALKGESSIGSTYGEDCAYNILVLGKYAFHNTKYTDPVAKKYFEENGTELIHVNQGYSKCAVAPVTEKAIITADNSIMKTCEKLGIECLKICWEGVTLSGFSHGFFGGASGRISRDKFFVCGSLQSHKMGKEIEDFLREKGFSPVFGEGEIEDIGSLIII